MSRCLRRLLALTAAVVVISATGVVAQIISGRISGTIVDASGGRRAAANAQIAVGVNF